MVNSNIQRCSRLAQSSRNQAEKNVYRLTSRPLFFSLPATLLSFFPFYASCYSHFVSLSVYEDKQVYYKAK